MSCKSRPAWIPLVLAGLFFAGCNLPTATAEPPTSDAALVVPTIAPTDSPESPSATTPATEEVAIVPTTPDQQNVRIAYTDNGNLWALEIGSDPVQLTNEGGVSEVRISDDGQWIAYVVRDPDQETAQLLGVGFDGSNAQDLMDADSFDALYPLEFFVHYTISNLDFLPGTHTLLFNTRGTFEGPGLAKNDDLLSVNVENGQITPLLSRGNGGDFTPSPDGAQVAIMRSDRLSFVDANGANLRSDVLTFTPVITYSEFLFYPRPVWSGGSVVVAVPRQDPFFGEDPGTVWSVNGEPQQLAQAEGDLFGPQLALPIVSPDGAHLAYFEAANDAGQQHLVIQKLDTGEQVIYDTGSLQWKGWGPDSYLFSYTKGSGLDLYLGDLLGEPESLGSGSSLRWINNEQYLYLAGSPGGWTLTLANTEGNKVPLAIISDGSFDFAE